MGKPTLPAKDIEKQIIEYLKKQNKKYSTNDLSQNLKLPKAQTLKIVEDLISNKKLDGKLYGKMYICQYTKHFNSDKEKMYQKEYPKLNEKLKYLSKVVGDLKAKQTKIQDSIRKLNELKIKYPTALNPTENQKEKAVDETIIEEPISDAEYKKLIKVYRSRMESFNNVQDVLRLTGFVGKQVQKQAGNV